MYKNKVFKRKNIYLKLSVSWERDIEWHSSPFAAPCELAAV